MADIPKIRFKGFTEPWEQRKLSDIAVLTSSKRVHAEDYVETGVPFYRGKEISELKEHKPISEVLYITEYKYNEISSMYGSPKEGDLLITAVGTLGNTWVIDQTPFYFKDGNLIWFKDIKCNPKYLDYAMSTADGQKKILASAIGSNQKALTMVKLNELEFMFPGKAEQDKIAEYFSYLDNLITLHQRKCDDTKELKKYMLQKMFPKNGEKFPEIRFKGFTEAWEQRKLGDLVISHNAGIYISKEDYGTGTNVIGVGNIYDNDIFDGEIYRLGPVNDEKFLLEENDLIYGESSLVPEGIARTVCVGKNGVGSAFAWHKRRVKLDQSVINSHFATLELNYNIDVRKYLISVSTQTALTGMTTEGYFGVTLSLPTVEEQAHISSLFKQLDHLITLHQRKCDTLKELKKYMLQNMFPKKG